jgi:N-acetylmuramoyl-L-alanine amidase
MRRIPPCWWLFPLLASAGAGVSAADLQGIRLIEDDAGTRIELALVGAADYKYFNLQNPERLVLDLQASRLAPGFELPAPTGIVANVRTGKPTAGTLRVVFELGRAAPARSRIEKDGSQSRLVLDLAARRSPIAVSEAPSVALEKTIANLPSVDLPTERTLVVGPVAEASPVPAPVKAAPVIQPQPQIESNPLSASSSAPVQSSVPRAPGRTVQDVIGSGQRKLVVAIDAGHGGKDPGALGPSGVREKAVTLAVARELARQIDADPGMRAVLIRDGDRFVPLKERYMKARSAQADLFISIHADASPNNTASGASVYVLSTRGASSQAARWLADQENAADLVGGVSLDHKDHNLAAVLLDLSQSATMRASDDIANQVLGSLKNVGKAHKPSIERANFVVLRSPDVPSMLIETGFITNPSEEQRLNDPGYRTRLATAITEGVRRYFSDQAPPGSWYASREDLRPTSRMHVVSRGETLSLIAARHGVGVDRIREANRRQGDAVRVGESLTIPLVASAPK